MTASIKVMNRYLIGLGLICLIILCLNSCNNSDSTGPGTTVSVPPPPAIRLVAVNTKWINVIWNESQKATVTGFIIQRASGTDSIYRTIANVGAAVKYYSDSTLTPDQYSYKVIAYNDVGNSRSSNVATVNLLAIVFPPTRLTATVVSLGSVRLQWTNNSANVTGFRIERRLFTDTVGTIIDSVGGGSTVYVDAGAPCGTLLTYRVQAFSGTTNSNFSTPSDVTTPFSTQSVLNSGIRTMLNSVGLFDDQNAVVVGSGGTIIRTTNGGLSWSKIKPSVSGNILSVSCVNTTCAYAVGDKGKILKSTDAGATWTSLSPGISSIIYGVYFLDTLNGFAVGQNGLFIRTSDGGLTWKLVPAGASVNLYSIVFSSNLVGYAVGGSGTILKTNDGGSSWVSQNTPASWTLRSVAFYNDSIGYAVGIAGVILKTTDGGNTWVGQPTTIGQNLRGVSVFSANNAIVVGERSTLIYTVTGGKTWLHIDMQGTLILTGIAHLPGNIGYFVGSSGTIYQIQACY